MFGIKVESNIVLSILRKFKYPFIQYSRIELSNFEQLENYFGTKILRGIRRSFWNRGSR